MVVSEILDCWIIVFAGFYIILLYRCCYATMILLCNVVRDANVSSSRFRLILLSAGPLDDNI